MQCPICGSPQISRRRVGRDAGSKVGALLGASIAAANAMRGARFGFMLGSCIGPVGSAVGGITGAVITGICTGSAVSAIGGALGSVADREVFDDCECDACGQTFRHEDAYAAVIDPKPTFVGKGFIRPEAPAAPTEQGGDDAARD
jgi:hypothetical protein